MNTLVIDEGFGALDEENRGLMVDNLRHLSENEFKNGRIIVVSHQDDVCDSFGHRYRLSRDENGLCQSGNDAGLAAKLAKIFVTQKKSEKLPKFFGFFCEMVYNGAILLKKVAFYATSLFAFAQYPTRSLRLPTLPDRRFPSLVG